MSTAVSLGFTGIAQAQAAGAKDPSQVAEVIVTGSALPTTLDAVAVPVSTVSQEKIQQTGVNTNALEILRKAIPAFQGRSNTGASNANNTAQNTAGGSQAQLRQLDTLVLINGRRAAISAIAGVNGRVFVDVSQIPPSAIDRVEVLTDGASAIYGSDAVGGVINFILKHNFQGLEVGGRYATAAGGYSERSAYVTAGAPLGDRVDVVLTGSVSKSDPLFQKDRSLTHPFIVSSTAVPGAVGANLLNLNLNSPSEATPTGAAATAPNIAALIPGVYTASTAAGIGATYDLSRFQTLLLEEKNAAVGGNFTGRLIDNDRLTAFGDFEYAHAESFTQFLPRVTAVTVPAGSPFNPTTTTLSAVQFGEPSLPKQYFNTSDRFRVTAGLRGEVDFLDRRWRWETAYTHSQDRLEQLQTNLIYAPNLALAVAGGFDASGNPVSGGRFSRVFSNFDTNAPLVLVPALDPFARGGRDPASLASLIGVEHINARSAMDTADAKVTADLITLPAGPVGLALGGAWRREALMAITDINSRNTGPTAQRFIGGQFFDPFSKDRKIISAFAEGRMPVTSPDWNIPGLYALDLIGAIRFEHYSDAGDSTVPKIGFRWQPIDPQLTIRGTYSKSFTAPNLYSEYGPTATRQGGPAIISNTFPGQPNSPFNAMDGNNPNLQPAKAKTFSLGLVFRPDALPHLRASVQYTAVNYMGITSGIGFNNILSDVNLLGSKSIFFANVARNNFPGFPGAVGFTNPGDLLAFLAAAPGVNSNNLYAIDQVRNLGGVKVRALDVNLDYQIPTERYGLFELETSATYLQSYKYQALPSLPFFELSGVASNSPFGGTEPKWRAYSTVNWIDGPWSVTLANSYIDSVEDQGAGGFTFANTHQAAIPVKSYATFDARVAYKLDELLHGARQASFAVGVNNLTDAKPPVALNAFPDNHADISTYSPIGRLWYVQLSARF